MVFKRRGNPAPYIQNKGMSQHVIKSREWMQQKEKYKHAQ
jgi:hypothetical protein